MIYIYSADGSLVEEIEPTSKKVVLPRLDANMYLVKYSEKGKVSRKDQVGKTLSIDFMDNYLSLAGGGGLIEDLKNMMLKSVTVVTGYEPFKFVCMKGNGYLFDDTPKVSDLIENAKGVR